MLGKAALLAAVLAVSVAALGQAPDPKPVPPVAPAPRAVEKTGFERRFEFLGQIAKRKNGARLYARIKEVTPATLTIQWAIDYDGPRGSLVILTPTFDKNGINTLMPHQAGFRFFAEGAGGAVMQMNYENNPRALDGFPLVGQGAGQWMPKEYYLTIDKGKPATGVATASLKTVVAGFKDKYPDGAKQPPTNLMVQFHHGPYDRAEHIDMDAWTGDLYAEPMRIAPEHIGW